MCQSLELLAKISQNIKTFRKKPAHIVTQAYQVKTMHYKDMPISFLVTSL